MGQALEFAINNRGGDHGGYGLPARVEMFGGGLETKGKGEQVKSLAIGKIIRDCVPICSFPGLIVTQAMLPDAVSCLLGESWSTDDVNRVGTRVMCQERLFNMREGIKREDDTLPARLLKEPKPDGGPAKGFVVPLEELKDDYYRAMGWDLVTGNPTELVLKELGITP